MKILVCGPHTSDDPATLKEMVFATLWNIHSKLYPIDSVIEGEAKMVDTFAREWAESECVEVLECPADWENHGRAAGPIRNKEMLSYSPNLVVAISDVPILQTRGTRNMLHQAQRNRVPTMIVAPETNHRRKP